MHGPIYVRRYLLNLARLAVTTGLAVGLFGTAALLLAGRFLAAYGDLLLLAAVLLPVLVCLLGFEKKPLRAVGLTARRCDPGDFFFGMLWAAIGFLGILWVASLLTGQNDAWIALLQGASVPRLAHYLIVGFCEELLFRGYLFQNLFCEWPFWRRSLLSAAVYLLPHSLCAGGNDFPALLFVCLFGLLANYLTYCTGSIWMCIGFHGMWNLLAATCFCGQGTLRIAAPLFLLLSFPLLRGLFHRRGRRAQAS